MAISYASFKEDGAGNIPMLTQLFGERAAINQNSILLGETNSAGAENADSLEHNPFARTEKQKLVAILKTDGPEAVINKTMAALDNGKIDMTLAEEIADEIYAAGYYEEAKTFAETLTIKSIDPAIAQAELDRQREQEERMQQEQQQRLMLYAGQPKF